jgi:hypothetical protein
VSDTTEMITWTRKEATLSRLSTEYTDTVILGLLNKTMDEVLAPLVAAARSGYWCHTFTRTLGAGNQSVRLPPRACPAIEQVDISADGVHWEPLAEALEAEAQDWMQEHGRDQYPAAYVVRSSYLYLLPAAVPAGVQLRAKCVMRPNTLVAAQAGGLINAFDPLTNILTLNSMPVSMPGSLPLTIGDNYYFDIIEPRGNFELALCDAVGTLIDSTHVQIGSQYSLGRVEAGDYLRCANQSEWPQLPKEFHSIVGSIAALPILRQRDLYERSDKLAEATGNALQRLREHISPRVRVQQHKPIQHNWR